MSTSLLLSILFAILGVVVILYDLWKYRDYDMWEDENGFHMKNKQKDNK